MREVYTFFTFKTGMGDEGGGQVTDLLVRALLRVQARLEEVPKDDGAALGEQVLRAANSAAQVLANHLQQDTIQVALVLIIHQAVVEDT